MNYIGKKFQIILTGNLSWLLNLCSYFIISCFFPLSWKGGTYMYVIWCESGDMRRGFDSHFQHSDKTNDRFASKFDQSLSFYSELAVFFLCPGKVGRTCALYDVNQQICAAALIPISNIQTKQTIVLPQNLTKVCHFIRNLLGSISIFTENTLIWWPVNFQHKWPVTRKMLPFHDVIMQMWSVPKRNCIFPSFQVLYVIPRITNTWMNVNEMSTLAVHFC